jgi:FXSXX-COOH protein
MAEEEVLGSELLDVTGIDLAALDAIPESALRTSLRRILTESLEPLEQYAAFQNAL